MVADQATNTIRRVEEDLAIFYKGNKHQVKHINKVIHYTMMPTNDLEHIKLATPSQRVVYSTRMKIILQLLIINH